MQLPLPATSYRTGGKRTVAVSAKPKTKAQQAFEDHLVNMLDQFFAFMDGEEDREEQNAELAEMDKEWKGWLKRRKRLYDYDKYENTFSNRVQYCLNDRMKRMQQKAEQPKVEPKPEPFQF